MKYIFICLILLSSSFSRAQETQPETPAAEPSTEQTAPPAPQTVQRGAQPTYTVNGHLSPLSTWLPMKWGLSLGYIVSERWTLEAEWTHRTISTSVFGVDAAGVVDQRFGLQARWFPSAPDSFNFIFGLFKSQFSFDLGNSYLQNISGTPTSTTWSFESIGPQIGLSNRWHWNNGFTLGADWFVVYLPVFSQVKDDGALQSISNSQDRSDLDAKTKIFRSIPQFDVFRITLGYSF